MADNIGKKYSNVLSNAMELQERGCLVFHGVDAKEMSQHFFLKTQRFDRIVYNFPHVGFIYPENSHCQIQLCFFPQYLFFLSLIWFSFPFLVKFALLFLFYLLDFVSDHSLLLEGLNEIVISLYYLGLIVNIL